MTCLHKYFVSLNCITGILTVEPIYDFYKIIPFQNGSVQNFSVKFENNRDTTRLN